ncbi:MAG: PTS sugar transporter subunit IIA [Spirochaetaceae bacterium]|jgi:PTS system fructose-specific IIC component/PTS system nitrogen regulatory IIA component|nr:PTS sugar transporter subunit IIA [Spirochaetaceae bacterium]
MIISELFKPEFIKIGLEAEDKDEAFEELVDAFCQASRLTIREEMLDAIREREQKMSTGVHKGIAIPHGKTGAVDKVYGVLGISRQGIDYDALDGQPVYLLFMLLIPQTETESHLRILKRLAELLEDPQFFTDLAAQNTPFAASEVIRKYETILTTID